MRKNWNSAKINVSFNVPSKTKTAIALLRIGYLLAFYYLGNRILYEGNIHNIRDTILDPNKNLLPHSGVFILSDSTPVNEGIHLLVEPSEYRSYFVIFQIKIKSYSRMISVPIPGPEDLGWTNYSKLDQLDKGTQLKFRDFTSNDYIENMELVNAYDYIFSNG